jgi:formylglycine-generating enzyme required for sulfatase activity
MRLTPSILAAGTLLFLACGGGGSPSAPPPAITSFAPAQSIVTTGSGTTLLAVYSGGDGTVDHGLGPVASGVPMPTGPLTASTTWVLTVANAGGAAATASAAVQVVPPPAITSFNGNGPLGAGSVVFLTAVFSGGSGMVTPGNLPVTSGVPLNAGPLSATTTYTLTVTNAAGARTTETATVAEVASNAELDLTITGAPSGATVRILGPGGYDRQISASVNLTGLAPGAYAVVPAGAWGTGQVYLASGAATVTVAESGLAAATVAYAPAPALTVEVPDVTKPGSAVPLDLVTIPAGTFQMGAYGGEVSAQAFETPQHPVTLTRPFLMGRFLVTQALWKAVTGADPAVFTVAGGGSATDDLTRPVEQVSWTAIAAPGTGFLALLNTATAATRPAGTVFRLPTEAEWEYACRAGTTTRFYWGDDPAQTAINLYAWWSGDSNARTQPVGSLGPGAANAFGLRDMDGDVFQWCQDWYGPYAAGSQADPAGPATGTFRVVRGGSWFHGAIYCRSANRSYSGPDDRFSSIGLRVVLATP